MYKQNRIQIKKVRVIKQVFLLFTNLWLIIILFRIQFCFQAVILKLKIKNIKVIK